MRKILCLLVILIIILLASSPWLTTISVENLIANTFKTEMNSVSDGCGPLNAGDIRNTKRIPFGFTSEIRYSCGMQLLSPNQPLAENWHKIYISPFGTIHGDFPRK